MMQESPSSVRESQDTTDYSYSPGHSLSGVSFEDVPPASADADLSDYEASTGAAIDLDAPIYASPGAQQAAYTPTMGGGLNLSEPVYASPDTEEPAYTPPMGAPLNL
ncbi:MAG: hypothetical protein ABIY70_27730, partial [Capsulimonas sp.]|uniref:hypothetical protein n=1 Tax=Capsulimonas sp. TaxID=2494211 RepID=UPI00326603B0